MGLLQCYIAGIVSNGPRSACCVFQIGVTNHIVKMTEFKCSVAPREIQRSIDWARDIMRLLALALRYVSLTACVVCAISIGIDKHTSSH